MAASVGVSAVLQGRLDAWAHSHYDSSALVLDLEPMPGHAGLSFGFKVVHRGEILDDLVMRIPPKGVRRSGNTDVLRQVPLLQALRKRRVPVAEVRWWDDDERWFEVPYIMIERLPGDTFNVREEAARQKNQAAARLRAASLIRQAVEALAAVHAVPWRSDLADWSVPRTLHDEVVFWDSLLERAAESDWVGYGRRTRERLLATIPADPVVGVFHGDFQTQNVLFHDDRLEAVLDWELSGIGAQLLDLGWLLMMNDVDSWTDGAGLAIAPPFEDIVSWYSAAIGRTVTIDDVAWYRALAGYRFGVIACFNVMLHRSGKRPDVEWERIAMSMPLLFERALELID